MSRAGVRGSSVSGKADVVAECGSRAAGPTGGMEMLERTQWLDLAF